MAAEHEMGKLRRWWRAFWRPSVKYSVGSIAIVFFVAGIIFWGGFNTVVESTNTLEFCISCHEMRNTVYQEYKETVHYSNRTGVRAICSDCHVPKTWVHKMARKFQASNELIAKAMASVDTVEKFESKRAELAQRTWRRMKENDSLECRNCHTAEAMNSDKQTEKAQSRHEKGRREGMTCIECHFAIAHKEPEGPGPQELFGKN